MNSTNKLYILDDDNLVSKTLEQFGKNSGFTTLCFEHAKPFFKAVNDSPPDVIILDLFLPDIDGIEALRYLSDKNCQSKLILASGAEDKILSSACRLADNLGLNLLGSLPKPFSLYKFRKILELEAKPSVVINPDPNVKALPTVELLQRAIVNDKIEAYYQPKLTTQSGQLTGFEVLSRWIDDSLGFISPDQFIVLAEQNSLINALSLNIFRQALDWFQSTTEAFYQQYPNRIKASRLTLSVNISATSLSDSSFFDALAQLSYEKGIPSSDIILEVTETGAMEDPVSSLSQLTRLRMKGFTLSIDDFGTGFSSMQQLLNLPFSELKIDKSFVLKLTESKENLKVVKGIIKLAHSLGMSVTAEGVESEAVWAALGKLGCDNVQGFYFGKPMSADQVKSWVVHNSETYNRH